MIWLLAMTAHAADEPSAQGYLELLGQGYAGVDGKAWLLVERLRPEITVPLHERFALTSTVEAALAEGRFTADEIARTIPLYASPEYENDFLHVSEAGDYLSVERLYLDAWLPFADIRVGRQALNWGSALLVNPTDPFPEVLLTEPWRPRAGVNAVRATVPIAERHQVQAVVGSDDVFQNLRVAGRATVNALQTDFSAVGAWREESEDGFVGADIRGTAGVGFWLEGAWHLDTDPYEEVAVGVDYSFAVLDGLVIQAQYYRNGAGSPDVDLATVLVPTDDPFAPVFHGRDYAMGAIALTMSPAWSASTLAVQNLGDGSALVVPVLTYVPTGWLEVSASAQVPLSSWGGGGELHPASDDLVISGIDLSGLVPDATFTLWTRASF